MSGNEMILRDTIGVLKKAHSVTKAQLEHEQTRSAAMQKALVRLVGTIEKYDKMKTIKLWGEIRKQVEAAQVLLEDN